MSCPPTLSTLPFPRRFALSALVAAFRFPSTITITSTTFPDMHFVAEYAHGSSQLAALGDAHGFPLMSRSALMAGVLAIILIGYVYLQICQCVGQLMRMTTTPTEHERFRYRSVGVQSQVTYTGERFKAYENGFRRSGEVTVEHHEFYKAKLA